MNIRREPLAMLIVASLATWTGCGNDRVPIHGLVTFNGKPIPEGTISLEPIDGNGPATGGMITAGKYDLVGNAAPTPGSKRVRITGVFKTGRKIPGGPPFPPGTMVEEVAGNLPDVFGNGSTLSCDVSRDGTKQIDFNLKSR
jgi:hypothetical protein